MVMMSNDGITHLLPVRNGARFLVSCLTSIVLNIQPGDQIVLIDDGSDDETLQIAHQFNFQGIDHEIKSTGGAGLVFALNLGFSISKHNWVARYDVDDIYRANRIQVQEKLRRPDVGAIFADYSFHDEHGKYLGFIPSPVTDFGCVISLLSSQQTAHPIALINKEMFYLAGGYQQQDFPAEDLSLWIRLSKISTLVSAPEILFSYRISKNSTSGSQPQRVNDKRVELLENWSLGDNRFLEFGQRLQRTKSEYEKSGNSKLRRVFFYRNLLNYHKRVHSPGSRILLLRFQFYSVIFLSPLTSMKALYFLFCRKRARASKIRFFHPGTFNTLPTV
jgi:glycosyltransferase involved in cell wall biosynthesis